MAAYYVSEAKLTELTCESQGIPILAASETEGLTWLDVIESSPPLSTLTEPRSAHGAG